ncbi:hypothetical protein L2E82_49026 [Cichorium intybus]|uniref:Uncharacterized protein n=1 Tax=Cichorium intybus TaxID=13427 RepID=A0ACB8YYJ3_CICIN|nr:hypothetical protein L2E82_49026 [Cichorium intybus]
MIRYKRCSYTPNLSFSQPYKTLFLSNSSLRNSTATDSIAAPQPASCTISRPLALRHCRATTIVITALDEKRNEAIEVAANELAELIKAGLASWDIATDAMLIFDYVLG